VFEDGTMKIAQNFACFRVKDEFPDIENFGEFLGKSVLIARIATLGKCATNRLPLWKWRNWH